MSRTNERGAIAVLWSVLLAFLAAPLSALVLTSYVRTATAAELQRAADQGALAGAAMIPLGDLNFVTTYVNATLAGATAGVGTPLPTLLVPGPANPLTVACDQARAALAKDDGFGRPYARPYSTSGQPTDPDGPVCVARYLPDSSLGTALANCANALTSGLPLPGLPDLGRTLPGLLRPGVEVTLTWRVRGPMDSLLGSGTPTTHQAIGRAVRRFKDLVVVPTVPLPLGSGTVDLNPALSTNTGALYDLLAATEAALTPTLAILGCNGIFAALRDDLADLNPDTNSTAPTASQVINDAAAAATPLLVAKVPPDPTGFLVIPFLDFVPVCVDPGNTGEGVPLPTALPTAPATGACAAATPGAFRSTLVGPP